MPTRWNEAFIPGVGKSAAVESVVVQAAEAVASRARSTAPRDTGEYANSIDVEVRYTANRVVATVVAAADHSMIVEARHGTLARALSAEASG